MKHHEFRQNADTSYTDRRRARMWDTILGVVVGLVLAVGLAGALGVL